MPARGYRFFRMVSESGKMESEAEDSQPVDTQRSKSGDSFDRQMSSFSTVSCRSAPSPASKTAMVRYVDGQKIVVMPPVYVTPSNRPVSL
mmetsp:Transcript_49529/g.146327  ORF Transcript_49529/g.146327 Transcript_49529/m.146327 type:complete len:90 (-) Transcript_49529:406-675(-)